MPPQTFYDILELTPTATPPEIKAKFREAARKHHPDVVGSDAAGARLFVRINEAYHTLIDTERRRHYDLSLQATPACAPPPPTPKPVDIARTMQEAEHAYFQGRMPEARSFCAKILKQDGRHGAALALLGDCLVALNRPAEAAVAYRLSLHVAPSALLQSKIARLANSQAQGQVHSQAQGQAQSQTQPAPARPPSAAAPPKPGGLLQRLFHPGESPEETA